MPAEPWHAQPLRDGEFDVAVMFRVTADSQEAATNKVERIVDDVVALEGRHTGYIVPMYVPGV